jgi:hypothetical protein
MSKRVRVTLELSESFVNLLRVNCQLSGLGNLKEEPKQHDVRAVLAIVALLEAMGATPEQVHAETPIEWRNDIEAVSDRREVLEV